MLANSKSRSGQSLVEMCAGLMAIPIFFLVYEGIGVVSGFQFNEETCREAARVAANGDPNYAEQRAKLIIARANEEKNWLVTDLRLVSVNNNVNPVNVEQSIGSIPFTDVEVVTAVDIKPDFLLRLIPGQTFLTFTSRQSFPYTYTPSIAPVNKTNP